MNSEIEKMPQPVLHKNRRTFATNDAIVHESRYTLADLYPITRFSQKMDKALQVASQGTTTSTSSSRSSKEDLPYTLDLVTKDDANQVLDMLKEFFFKDEPLNASVDLGECQELETYSLKCISENCSFKAVSKADGKIIGVFLNGLIHKPPAGASVEKYAEKCKHEKFKKIMELMDYVGEQFDIFDLYPDIDVVLDGKILSVDTNYRGMGIAVELTNRTLQYMRENNIFVLQVICSSYYSARLMEKFGLKDVYHVAYSDFKDDKGEQILKPVEPHRSIQVMVKCLENMPEKQSRNNS